MSIRRLEVSAASFRTGLNIPTPTTLVGDQWQVVRVRDILDEQGILSDRAKAIYDGEVGAAEFG